MTTSSNPARKTGSIKKAAWKKAPAKTSASERKTSKAPASRKYSRHVSEEVREELHEMHQGQLTMGKSQKKVTNPKQAIAIGLAKARREGAKIPPNPNTGR